MVYVFFICAFIGWIGFSLLNINDGQRNSVSALTPTPELDVRHSIKGDKLFLDFQLKHFSLHADKVGAKPVYGEGYIQLYIDGKKVDNIYKRAHVYPSLTHGRHTVVVELTHHNHEPYGITQQFTVDVPKHIEPKRLGE